MSSPVRFPLVKYLFYNGIFIVDDYCVRDKKDQFWICPGIPEDSEEQGYCRCQSKFIHHI